ncbi:hypothetical protein F5146DRAFT_1125125 [Armillaria mellea]|nr:hypothetical protein F5146DRAFT_1125125 [Armillaria mellea]
MDISKLGARGLAGPERSTLQVQPSATICGEGSRIAKRGGAGMEPKRRDRRTLCHVFSETSLAIPRNAYHDLQRNRVSLSVKSARSDGQRQSQPRKLAKRGAWFRFLWERPPGSVYVERYSQTDGSKIWRRARSVGREVHSEKQQSSYSCLLSVRTRLHPKSKFPVSIWLPRQYTVRTARYKSIGNIKWNTKRVMSRIKLEKGIQSKHPRILASLSTINFRNKEYRTHEKSSIVHIGHEGLAGM